MREGLILLDQAGRSEAATGLQQSTSSKATPEAAPVPTPATPRTRTDPEILDAWHAARKDQSKASGADYCQVLFRKMAAEGAAIERTLKLVRVAGRLGGRGGYSSLTLSEARSRLWQRPYTTKARDVSICGGPVRRTCPPCGLRG